MMRFSLARVLFLLILGGFTFPASAADSPPPLVVVLLPGTSLDDWRAADAPTLHSLMATGAVAVMNTRTARLPNDHRRETPESAVLTLGAGSRAAGGSEITGFSPTREPSHVGVANEGELFLRRTTNSPPADGAINVRWPQVVRENATLGYDLLPGNLGSGLEAHGIPTMAGGGRFADALATDRDGTVQAAVQEAHLPHPLPRFLVWDAGGSVASADPVLQSIASEVKEHHGQMIVLSPFVSDAKFRLGARLAPVLLWGQGVPPGLIYSPSTHRAGLIADTDFAPSVTAFLGETSDHPWLPARPFGRPWAFVGRTGAVDHVALLEQSAYRQAEGMKALPVVAVCLGLLTACLFLRVGYEFLSGTLCVLPGIIVFALLVSPAPTTAALWAGSLAVLFLASRRWVSPAHWVLWTSVVTTLVLVGDMLTGNTLMQHTLLGYSAVEGARYYGIGNEAMGPFVGSALVTGALLYRQKKTDLILMAMAFLGLSLLLGFPSAGAKAGGLLVALAAFATFLWTARGGRVTTRLVLALIVAVSATLVLVSLFDWHHQAGARTHIGAAVDRITTGGLGEAWDIIRRKLAVESRLLYHSAWAVPLWTSVGALVSAKRQKTSEGTARQALFTGGAAAMVACLAVNDAGVVAAALCGSIVVAGFMVTDATEERPMSQTADAV